jgi:hypothetical protein
VKRGAVSLVIAANLLVLVALVFAFPHLMVSPGPLVGDHAELTTNCFACHAAFRGASSERCVVCHALSDIGLRTTKGVPVVQRKVKTSFHQALIEQDCMACHSDHLGPKLSQRSRKPFSHALLRTDLRGRCEGCHAAPANDIHRDLTMGCAQCHKAEAWKPAGFDHASLSAAAREHCETCHRPPADSLHRQIAGNCLQCHAQDRWKPATFDHAKYFLLDRDHNAPCATCHSNDDYRRYTCYGCHEHQPDKMRSKHVEEGITDFANCVACHRSASEKGEGKREGSRKGREKD